MSCCASSVEQTRHPHEPGAGFDAPDDGGALGPARSFLKTGGVPYRIASKAAIRMSASCGSAELKAPSTGIGNPQLATGVWPSIDLSFQQ